MSLINDVLRDLDHRRTPGRGHVPPGVRAPARAGGRGRHVRRLLLWSTAALFAVGGGYLAHDLLPQPASDTAAPAKPPTQEEPRPPAREMRVPRLQHVTVHEAADRVELRFLADGPVVHMLERSDDGGAVTLQLPVASEDVELPELLQRMPQLDAVDWRMHGEHLTLDLRFDTPPRLQARRLATGVALEFDFPDAGSVSEDRPGDTSSEQAAVFSGGAPEQDATNQAEAADSADSESPATGRLVDNDLGIPVARADSVDAHGLVKSPARSPDASSALRRGQRAAETGNVDQAVAIYRDALDERPDAWRVRRALAASHERLGDRSAAVDVLAAGLAYESGAGELARLKARLLMDGDPERAVRVLEAHPAPVFGEGRWHALLAALYRQTGHPAEAVPLYRELARQQSSDARWWLGLGVSLEDSAEPARARAAYRRALAVGGLNSELTAFLRQRIESLE